MRNVQDRNRAGSTLSQKQRKLRRRIARRRRTDAQEPIPTVGSSAGWQEPVPTEQFQPLIAGLSRGRKTTSQAPLSEQLATFFSMSFAESRPSYPAPSYPLGRQADIAAS